MNLPKIRDGQRLGSCNGERIRRRCSDTPRIFSLSPTGGEGWGEGEGRASLDNCSAARLGHSCELYSLPPLVRPPAPSPWPSPPMGEREVAAGRAWSAIAS